MDRAYETGPLPEAGVLTGGWDVATTTREGSTAAQGASVAAERVRRVAVDPSPNDWPTWASAQLEDAVVIARKAQDRGDRLHLAATLYREWFYPSIGRAGELRRAGRPLVGLYRGAHAGSTLQRTGDDDEDDCTVLRRHDVIGRDGWWRTWGEAWTPPRSRPGSVRLLLTPRPDRLGAVVTTITRALLDSPESWMLACATELRRLRRTGSIVLDLPSLDALPDNVLDDLAPLVREATPPLCLPIQPGVALAEFPDNGMTFGEHRCHLIALALRRADAAGDPLRVIADVFAAHGIDASAPYRLR